MEDLDLINIREHVSQRIEEQDDVEEIEQHLIQHLRTAGMYIYVYT
jgi:hypothetical protein